MDETNDGQNDQGNEGSEDQGNEPKINPGAIRKSTTNSLLNALSNASGQQFDSVEAAVAYVTRTSARAAAEPIEPVVKTKGKAPTNDLADQFAALQTKLATQERALQEKTLEGDIRSVMGAQVDEDFAEFAMSKVKANIQWSDDGTYTIVNAKGQERYAESGQPLSLQGLVQEVFKSNPKILKQANRGGSGLRPGQSNFAGVESDTIPDYARDPAAFNAWARTNGLGKNVGLKGLNVTATSSTAVRKLI